jgi:hypothetical protein
MIIIIVVVVVVVIIIIVVVRLGKAMPSHDDLPDHRNVTDGYLHQRRLRRR